MILAIVFAYLGYQRAKQNGRSGGLWAVILLVAFIGIQLLAGVAIGICMALAIAFLGWSENIFETWAWPVNILGWVVATGTCWILLKFLDRPTAPEPAYGTPPPPSEYGGQMVSSFGNDDRNSGPRP